MIMAIFFCIFIGSAAKKCPLAARVSSGLRKYRDSKGAHLNSDVNDCSRVSARCVVSFYSKLAASTRAKQPRIPVLHTDGGSGPSWSRASSNECAQAWP